MFSFSPSNYQIPTLTFTKAELVYVLSVLTAEIPPTDNTTKLEMVEIRYYLNKIKGTVAQAVADGTLGQAMRLPDKGEGEDTTPKPKAAPMPSMAELRGQFPNLTEDEITEVFKKVKEERMRESAKAAQETSPPPAPSFIAKQQQEDEIFAPSPKPLTEQEEQDRKNSKKFAAMLGSA